MADQQKQQQSSDDQHAQKASTVGVDVNEEQVRTHPGFEKASDHAHPNPHIAGQTPAAETNQPTYAGQNDLQAALGQAERALSANLVYENGVASTRPEHLDPVIEALESALKAVKAAKS
jgi:hypothetical protein